MFINRIKEKIMSIFYQFAEIDRINIATAILHQKTFPKYKNYCEGRKLVVCAAGPTLNKYIPIKDAVHIAVNRSFLYDKVDFDFIFAQDWEGVSMVQQELLDYNPDTCIKLLGSSQTIAMGKKEIPESFALKCKALRFNIDNYIYKDGFKSRFVKDIDYNCLGGMPNVGISVMQFALFMNPAELYIVGCDMSGAHFANGNHSKEQIKAERKMLEEKWEKDHDRLINKWMEFKHFAEIYYPSTRIIAVNPVGLRGLFEDLDQ